MCYKSNVNSSAIDLGASEELMRLIMVTALILSVAGAMAAQRRGVISGGVKPPTPGAVVVATNQVTSNHPRGSMAKPLLVRVQPGLTD